jgi:hypothetical protein
MYIPTYMIFLSWIRFGSIRTLSLLQHLLAQLELLYILHMCFICCIKVNAKTLSRRVEAINCWVIYCYCYMLVIRYRAWIYNWTSRFLSVSQSLMLQPTVSRPVCLRYLLFFDNYGPVFVGRPLWRENGSVFCICSWSSPAQYFSGRSVLRLATIFYCLRYEIFLFIASYDSQGHGEGIRPRLHTGNPLS